MKSRFNWAESNLYILSRKQKQLATTVRKLTHIAVQTANRSRFGKQANINKLEIHNTSPYPNLPVQHQIWTNLCASMVYRWTRVICLPLPDFLCSCMIPSTRTNRCCSRPVNFVLQPKNATSQTIAEVEHDVITRVYLLQLLYVQSTSWVLKVFKTARQSRK